MPQKLGKYTKESCTGMTFSRFQGNRSPKTDFPGFSVADAIQGFLSNPGACGIHYTSRNRTHPSAGTWRRCSQRTSISARNSATTCSTPPSSPTARPGPPASPCAHTSASYCVTAPVFVSSAARSAAPLSGSDKSSAMAPLHGGDGAARCRWRRRACPLPMPYAASKGRGGLRGQGSTAAAERRRSPTRLGARNTHACARMHARASTHLHARARTHSNARACTRTTHGHTRMHTQ
jgi:hypothetical protein